MSPWEEDEEDEATRATYKCSGYDPAGEWCGFLCPNSQSCGKNFDEEMRCVGVEDTAKVKKGVQ